jgi:Arc/MetJ-type ribon-helix-helix transcriptional regulator
MSEFDGKHGRKKHRERHRRGEHRRDNVVMVRVNEGDLNRIDELVDSGQFNSRSEATAFLISEGIKAKQQMFEKMAGKISQIQNLRTELGAMIAEDTKPSETVDPEPDNAGGS